MSPSPQPPPNGKTKVIEWLIGFIRIVTLAYLFWIGNALVEAKVKIATLEANYQSIDRRLNDIQASLARLEDR